MQTFMYGAYVLIWPALTLAMLGLISHAVWRDYREAKRSGSDMV